MKVFISWSGAKSKAVAKLLRDWLPVVIRTVEPWMSETDIKAGEQWLAEMQQALTTTEYCIICLDSQNLNAPWILFEAGFIAGSLGRAICPYLIDISPAEIKNSPLYLYQAKPADEQGTRDLVCAINSAQKSDQMSETLLNKAFDYSWLKLKKQLDDLAEEQGKELNPLLEEVLPLMPPQALIPPKPSEKPKPAPFKLWLFNTSFYPRKGHVTHDWQSIYDATEISPEELIVRDEDGNELPAQVDDFGQTDPTQATLVFSLVKEIPPVQEDYSTPSAYVTIERGQPSHQGRNQPRYKIVDAHGEEHRIKLLNDRLVLLLELAPEPWGDGRNWYAGSATSVLLEGREVLDAFNAQLNLTDTETRCMQLDRLQLLYPDGAVVPHEPPDLIRNRYQLISKSTGAVRAIITIAAQPFEFNSGSYNHDSQMCRLYRVISLYKGANYVIEELKVSGIPRKGLMNEGLIDYDFKTRYFSYMDMGLDPPIQMVNQKPKWFTLGSRWLPQPGYGFASDAKLSPVANPHDDFPRTGSEHKSFSWWLEHCRKPKSLHLFMRREPKELESEARRLWHEVIDKPLIARTRL